VPDHSCDHSPWARLELFLWAALCLLGAVFFAYRSGFDST
jgi:hypothetical protein